MLVATHQVLQLVTPDQWYLGHMWAYLRWLLKNPRPWPAGHGGHTGHIFLKKKRKKDPTTPTNPAKFRATPVTI